MAFRNNLSKLFSQPFLFYVWLLPAWIMLGLSRLAILLLSFKRIARWLGVHEGIATQVPIVAKRHERMAASIGRATRVAARFTPWTSNCFPQAITARLILALYGIPHALYFGVKRDGEADELLAHAWVVSGRSNVTGGRSFGKYTTVGCFVSL